MYFVQLGTWRCVATWQLWLPLLFYTCFLLYSLSFNVCPFPTSFIFYNSFFAFFFLLLYVHLLCHVDTSFESDPRCASPHAGWSAVSFDAFYPRCLCDCVEHWRFPATKLSVDMHTIFYSRRGRDIYTAAGRKSKAGNIRAVVLHWCWTAVFKIWTHRTVAGTRSWDMRDVLATSWTIFEIFMRPNGLSLKTALSPYRVLRSLWSHCKSRQSLCASSLLLAELRCVVLV